MLGWTSSVSFRTRCLVISACRVSNCSCRLRKYPSEEDVGNAVHGRVPGLAPVEAVAGPASTDYGALAVPGHPNAEEPAGFLDLSGNPLGDTSGRHHRNRQLLRRQHAGARTCL